MARVAENRGGSATVSEVERYATEDGPGIRTVVFFKGCNLHCRWCQNPESHSSRPQVMHYRNRCVACRRCLEACRAGAIGEVPAFGFITDHQRCRLCGECIDACLADARKIVGREMSLDDIMEEIRRDRTFYDESGGGVTFSGGEPLLQADAVRELARRCKEEGIHTAIETAGSVPWPDIEGIFSWLDLLYFDLKHIDSEAHRRYTGVPLDLILANLSRAAECFDNLVVRIPVVPGVNAAEQTMTRMFRFLLDDTKVHRVELLPFHRLGLAKYGGLGVDYAMGKVGNMSRDDCAPFAEIGRKLGLSVRVGAGGQQ
jgi:pyruvate formate lyase activating enzyme